MTDRRDGAGRSPGRGGSSILRPAALLLLGVVASLSLAVIAASTSSRGSATLREAPVDAGDLRWWNDSSPIGRDLDWTLIDPHRRRAGPGLVVTTLEARATSRETGQPDVARADRIRAGWPWPCLEGVTWFLMRATSPPSSPEIVDHGLVPVNFGRGPRLIPTRPVMGGLILDSIVMAAIFGAIGRVPSVLGWVRGIFRRRAGRCPACGYPGIAIRCPECGIRTNEPRASC